MKPLTPDKWESRILPQYPRTVHLPWKPNAHRSDLIAKEKDCAFLFTNPNIYVEEKVDGANCGMAWVEGQPVVRNRNHLLHKSHAAKTAAKMQFGPLWNWFYENKHKFEKLEELTGMVSVYGEWLFALHGLHYTKLPDLFLAYDLYSHDRHDYLDPGISRKALAEAGFYVVPLLHQGPFISWEAIEALTQQPSLYTNDRREGVYVKVSDGKVITNRYKMVRHDFIQGEHWSDRGITKNLVVK